MKKEEKADYEKIGFKAGLEIHQQLSGKKLFCDCSTDLKEETPLLQITRNMIASSSELGEKDIAAEYESKKAMDFVYHVFRGESCLVESDSEPPHEISKSALETALSVAKSLKMNIPDRLVVMRKIVVDGSACSSFQRTLIVGVESENSHIETSQGKVRITSLCLEEDACKIIRKDAKTAHYSLSRQGIPLLEIRTEPDIKNPEHAKETAEKIGLILRSFDGIKRGIGTIRQDVNLSVKGKARIEIKGFQDLRVMPRIIETEVNRLLSLKEIKPEVRKANFDFTTTFMRPMPGSARMYPDTDLQIINPAPILKNIQPTELLTDKLLNLEEEYNLDSSISRELIRKKINLKDYLDKYPTLDAKTIANILIEVPKSLRAREGITPTLQHLNSVLAYLERGVITREAIPQLLISFSKDEKVDTSQFAPPDKKEIERNILDLIKSQPDITPSAIMGILMKKHRGKISGRELSALMEKILGGKG
jgi:Glu-tRNA(Gln) amidotransferase subunit E-like FAD-binding protein